MLLRGGTSRSPSKSRMCHLQHVITTFDLVLDPHQAVQPKRVLSAQWMKRQIRVPKSPIRHSSSALKAGYRVTAHGTKWWNTLRPYESLKPKLRHWVAVPSNHFAPADDLLQPDDSPSTQGYKSRSRQLLIHQEHAIFGPSAAPVVSRVKRCTDTDCTYLLYLHVPT